MGNLTERVYINNIPLSELGVVLGVDSYKSLLQYPSLKSVTTNDWAEYNYTEPDLDNPTLSSRQVTMNFHAKGAEGYETFLDYLYIHAVNKWYFAELGILIELRVQSNSLKNASRKWQSFSLTFADDTPFVIDGDEADNTQFGGGGISIDDYDFAHFGVWILEKTLDSIRQVGNVKERLKIDENSRHGAVYDTEGDVKTMSSDFNIKCLIRGKSFTELVNNYYALLNYITRPKTRRIFVSSTMEYLECYYKSSTCENVHAKLASGLVGIAFTLTFTLIDKGILKVLSNDKEGFALTDDKGNFLTR